MANKSSSLTPQIGAQDLSGNGNPPLHNEILLNLSATEQGAILAKSEFVLFPVHTILNEISESIKFSYFVNSGLVSIVTVMSDGKSVEVGLAGKEGFVGLPLLVDYQPHSRHRSDRGKRLSDAHAELERSFAESSAIGTKSATLFPRVGPPIGSHRRL